MYSFQCARTLAFVKSTKTPGPPHQVPTARPFAGPSGLGLSSEAARNIPFSIISERSGCTRSIPGLMLGETVMPRSFIAANQAAGSLKRFRFQVKEQRLMPSLVSTAQYPEESWKPSAGISSSRVVSMKSRIASSQSFGSSG